MIKIDNSSLYLKGKADNYVPIWCLRQAGRYMPEYLKIRNSASNFIDLCYDHKKVIDITMQPIEAYDLDAAIIFSDILILPHALGWKVSFEKGEGPILEVFEKLDDFKKLSSKFLPQITNIYKAISEVRSRLDKSKSLIGFVGSPWTVISYMLEGRGKQDYTKSKYQIYVNHGLIERLSDFITEMTILHLKNQIDAGADVVMLFDSWSNILSNKEYQDFVIRPTKKIVDEIKKYKEVPIIGFPRGSGYYYDQYIEHTGIDIVSVDQFVPIEMMAKWQKNIIVQGNLDPVILTTNEEIISQKVDDIFSKVDKRNFIFNLGHGILQTTPPANVKFLVDYVRYKYNK
jgi:uroporphyrinogen decarboxylase